MFTNLILFYRNYKYFLFYAILTPIICVSLIFIVRKSPYLGQYYVTNIYPIFPNTLGRFFSLFPFSFLEICLYLLMLSIIFVLLLLLKNLFNPSGRNKLLLQIPKLFIITLCFCSTIFLMLTLTCSINYSRDGIAKDINIIVSPSSHESLVSLCLLLIDDVNYTVSHSGFVDEIDTTSLHTQAIQSMEDLGKEYPSLQGYYPNPKPVLMSSWMSNLNMTGLFSPYTIEANYNNDVVDYIKPYTICHELAHLRGYIREDEANFIAYLACSNSKSPQLQYSGTLNALSYTLSALYKNSTSEEYHNLLIQLPNKALLDLVENQNYWLNHQGTASRISVAANNTYLKANAQADGIKSYGRMVDLLLAYYGLNHQSV